MDFNLAKSAKLIDGLALKILHKLVLESINTALLQSKYSHIYFLKSPVTVHPDGNINNSTIPMAPVKDGSKADFEPSQKSEFQ